MTIWLLFATACGGCAAPVAAGTLVAVFVRSLLRRSRLRALRATPTDEVARSAWSIAEWFQQQLRAERLHSGALDAALAARDLGALCTAWPEVARALSARARHLGDAENRRRRDFGEAVDELTRRARDPARVHGA
jgi:hypothetical protein